MDGLRELLRRGAADVVLAHAVDRLSRNQNQTGVLFDEIEQARAWLECVTEKFEDTPEGRFILAARAFIAEVERAKICERTTQGKEMRARAGKLPQATGCQFTAGSAPRLYGQSAPRTVAATARAFSPSVVLMKPPSAPPHRPVGRPADSCAPGSQ
jgi:DNA invertase Pin-like site-specific DNA recombinase